MENEKAWGNLDFLLIVHFPLSSKGNSDSAVGSFVNKQYLANPIGLLLIKQNYFIIEEKSE